MRIGILGGTFDPIHYGHLFIAENARRIFELERVLLIPAGQPPHKQTSEIAPPKHRLEMVRLAAEGNPGFTVDDLEVKKRETSYTYETIMQLKGQDDLFYIIGADTLLELPGWYRFGELAKLVRFIVADRWIGGNNNLESVIQAYENRFGGVFYKMNLPLLEISSTEIRKRISENQTCRYLLPDRVLEYIIQNNLYGGHADV